MNSDSKILFIEETRSSLNNQLNIMNDISKDSIEIIKINLLIGSLALTALKLSKISTSLGIISFLIGSGFLLFSTTLGILIYLKTRMRAGIGSQDLKDLQDDIHGEDVDVRNKLLKSYGTWIEENSKVNKSQVKHMTGALLTTTLGLISLSIGLLSTLR